MVCLLEIILHTKVTLPSSRRVFPSFFLRHSHKCELTSFLKLIPAP